ncbi:nicotinamide/nicotinic acid mononucleotide adenylyltransferase 3 isoform X2 [Malaya genurostris]|uniref:nicotinamide/nicotinic acid mononucleotide adenylyltransferase 3 isoform X2 n=1 Tax=Malaya genurostris TaxID=325434 RepID=UPI0026F3C138|nr:nicotinamide/nicotinic acid mononucleotide adenylyltransferase 3 isoform X2 [Malaya genurostris]
MRMTSSSKIMLIACGSFSPPTPMHFRMFEIARDHFHQLGMGQVVGGIVSPVHDSYGKKGLVSATHRCTMIKLSLQSSEWIRLSEWETQQEEWTRTRLTLQYHQNYINSYMKDSNSINEQQIPSWVPAELQKNNGHIQLKLLCGADLLESFSTPGLWKDEDIEAIVGQHGIVVISRAGSNPEQFIFNSDILSRYRRNITIVTNWVTNDVSSTLVRRLLSRSMSVKYLLDDYVMDYIKRQGLYGCTDSKYILSANTGGEKMSISPVSPDKDNDLYVECQNELNSVNTLESMDETDFPRTTLNRVFCCGTENNAKNTSSKNMRGSLSHPGGAVRAVQTTATTVSTSSIASDSGIDSISHHTVDDKVICKKLKLSAVHV